MRDFGPDINASLAALDDMRVRHFVWIEAPLRSTGVVEGLGLWTGGIVRDFDVDGETRTYQGAGGLLGIDPIKAVVGLQVRRHSVTLSGITPEAVNLINLYDPRLAPVSVHKIFFDPEKGVQLGDPVRLIKGFIDELPVPKPPVGGSQNIRMTIASASRSLTRTLTVNKSDEAQRRAYPGDKGRQYAAVSNVVRVFWGSKDKRG